MNTLTLKTIARRSLSLAGVASVAAMVLPGVAAASPTGQLTVRSAVLSNSKVSPTTPAGTSVSITVTNATAGTITGAVVSFCTTPTYGTCTAVTGLSASGVTLTSSSYTNLAVSGTTASAVTLNSGTKVVSAGGTDTIVLAGLVNPTTTGTFYVRVQTQTGAAVDHDFGGIAVSTAKGITVTADVAEALIFRVANTIATCNGTDETNIPDPNDPLASDLVTLAPNPMTTSGASTGTAQFCVVSNAQNGYAVTYADWGSNSYDLHKGFWNGSYEFPGSFANTASAPGSEQFGFNVTVLGSGTGTVAAGYLNSNLSYDDSGSAVQIAQASGATVENIYTLHYIANVSATTPGGTYRAHQMFVCTATF